jgi:hypothetical protein
MTPVQEFLHMMPPVISSCLRDTKAANLGSLGHEINLLVTDCAPEFDSLQSDLFILTLHTRQCQLYRQHYHSIAISRRTPKRARSM